MGGGGLGGGGGLSKSGPNDTLYWIKVQLHTIPSVSPYRSPRNTEIFILRTVAHHSLMFMCLRFSLKLT